MTTARSIRVAQYVRVSKLDQDPTLQEHETAELVRARGWTIAETYVDHGISGAKARRPGLDKMLRDARKGRFDLVLVWRSDRLFRSLKDMVATIEELSSIHVGFVSCREPFDTTSASGRLMLHLVSAFAEFERAVLVERVRAGLAVARRRGARIGRPRVRVDLERAHELRAKGMTVRQVARELKIGAATLCRALAAERDPNRSTPTTSGAA